MLCLSSDGCKGTNFALTDDIAHCGAHKGDGAGNHLFCVSARVAGNESQGQGEGGIGSAGKVCKTHQLAIPGRGDGSTYSSR